MRRLRMLAALTAVAFVFSAPACKKKEGDKKGSADKAKAKKAKKKQEEGLETGKGVDLENKTIHIGALNDESGPAASIGKPFAVGKRLVAKRVNEEGDLLPEGWSVKLHEEDHGYNPSKSVQAYKKIKDDILFVATSFGTPNTLPLRKFLEKDKVVAFPASLSSKMAEHEFTPPIAPSYKLEAMRAMDFAVEDAGGADAVKAGIVYQKDDYGKDGLAGWEQAAKAHDVEIVSKQTVSAGQKDVTAAVKALKDAGANYVMLTVLPSSAGPVLGTAGQLKYAPKWIGNTPAWIDKFFAEKGPLPAKAFANFHWSTGLPFWGEDVSGMEEFTKAYEQYGKDQYSRDFYILTSYIQGLAQLEILRRCIEDGSLTRENFVKQMHTLDGWNAGGLVQEINLSKVPYVTGTQARILKPKMKEKSWEVAGEYATPEAFEGAEAEREAIEKAAEEGGDKGTEEGAEEKKKKETEDK